MARYTAKDMREMALVEESYGWNVVAKMLRQAADEMEREEREARNELARILFGVGEMTFRREVGEWEEVK